MADWRCDFDANSVWARYPHWILATSVETCHELAMTGWKAATPWLAEMLFPRCLVRSLPLRPSYRVEDVPLWRRFGQFFSPAVSDDRRLATDDVD
jgi:hypothetical protein